MSSYPGGREEVVIPPEVADADAFAVQAQTKEDGGQPGEHPEGGVELRAEIFVRTSVLVRFGTPRLQPVSCHVG